MDFYTTSFFFFGLFDSLFNNIFKNVDKILFRLLIDFYFSQGAFKMNSQDLWDTLLASGALVDTVKPTVDINIEDTPLKSYPVSKLKVMLMDLIRVIEPSDGNVNMADSNTSIHSTTMNEYISPIVTNTTINQTEILSDSCTSQNQDCSTIIKNSSSTDSHDCLISMNIPSGYVDKKNKEEEEARILRRKYHNKYKYLNITKQQCLSQKDLNHSTQVIPNNDEKELDVSNTEAIKDITYVPHVILTKFDNNYNLQLFKNKAYVLTYYLLFKYI